MTPLEKMQWATAVLWFSGMAMIVSAMPHGFRIVTGLALIALGVAIRVVQ